MSNKFSQYGGAFMLQTISWGTLRDEDLIRAFTEELHRLAPFSYGTLRREAEGWLEDYAAGALATSEHAEHGPEIVLDLFDALNYIANINGAWFGTTEGDGADFCFQSDYEEDYDDEPDYYSADIDGAARDDEATA